MFSEEDKKFIAERGSDLETVKEQIEYFKKGFPPLPLKYAATTKKGILKLTEADITTQLENFDTLSTGKKLVKFVPASGAASRMFKSLFAFMDEYTGSEEDYQKMVADQGKQSVYTFFKNLDKFAFYEELADEYQHQKGQSMAEDHLRKKYVDILQVLLTEDGLNYGNLPKGLLEFHHYIDRSRTPVEEHLVEGAHYAKDIDNNVAIHFTVSPEHQEGFREHIDGVQADYEKLFGVKYDISFSQQKKSTDTIAVDMNNAPFRDSDGTLLFRPGGHGALIENLNDLDADLAFIKNIDNVVPDHLKAETYTYKKALAGVLLQYQEKIFHFIELLEGDPSEEVISEVEGFVHHELCIESGLAAGTPTEEKVDFLLDKLQRPIRVCGMVRNMGEPGGGPFWAKNPDGTVSLQIVESAQIDMDDDEQQAIVQQSTHFNPVDLVCSLKDHTGKKFDLLKHRDPMTGFISYKSKDGKDLKALELPGLWNGAMSDWNTIFVEVPLITFNPVKTINDLLRDEHQPG